MWPGLARASAVRRPKPLDAPGTSMILLITDFLLVLAPIRKRGRSGAGIDAIGRLQQADDAGREVDATRAALSAKRGSSRRSSRPIALSRLCQCSSTAMFTAT